MPFQLTYHSLASPEITEKDIKDILNKALIKNKNLEITGCLIYHNGFFLQILEGAKNDVLDLMDQIKLDKRHDLVKQLSTDESQFRIFKEWTMAYYHVNGDKELNKEELQIRDELIELSDTSKKPNFTMKVFWYNVRQILLSEGYYRT